jgi:hypothetical protein
MPRKARIVAPGALHHIISGRIKHKAIFNDITDRTNLLQRLSRIISETETSCYAWVLIYQKLEKFKSKYRAINLWICCLINAGLQNREIERTSPFFHNSKYSNLMRGN